MTIVLDLILEKPRGPKPSKIAYKILKSLDFSKDLKILGEISKDFKLKILSRRLHNASKSGHFLKSMENVEDGKISESQGLPTRFLPCCGPLEKRFMLGTGCKSH